MCSQCTHNCNNYYCIQPHTGAHIQYMYSCTCTCTYHTHVHVHVHFSLLCGKRYYGNLNKQTSWSLLNTATMYSDNPKVILVLPDQEIDHATSCGCFTAGFSQGVCHCDHTHVLVHTWHGSYYYSLSAWILPKSVLIWFTCTCTCPMCMYMYVL